MVTSVFLSSDLDLCSWTFSYTSRPERAKTGDAEVRRQMTEERKKMREEDKLGIEVLLLSSDFCLLLFLLIGQCLHDVDRCRSSADIINIIGDR
jgi:hypothetical protein